MHCRIAACAALAERIFVHCVGAQKQSMEQMGFQPRHRGVEN